MFSTVVATVPRTLTEKHKIQRLEEENERLRDEMLALRGAALRVAADHNNAFPHCVFLARVIMQSNLIQSYIIVLQARWSTPMYRF